MTGCERILARLEQGPATAAELYGTTYTVVHSRISDLRKRGYLITCEKVAGEGAASYVYTLCAEISDPPRAAEATPPSLQSEVSAQISLEAV